MRPVVQVGDEHVGAGEVVEHRREATTGLLVLPGTGQEGGHRDAVHERAGGQRITALGGVEGRLRRQLGQIPVLAAQELVGVAGLVTLLDPTRHPPLAVGVVGPLPGVAPALGEAVVVDAPGIDHRAVGVLDHREGSDCGQTRRLGLGHVQLADPRVGDADHAHVVAVDPVLGGDRLDHVVAVDGLEGFVEVEGTPRATRAPDVHPHGRPSEEAVHLGDRLRLVGAGRVVPRVLDDRGVRALLDGPGQPHHGGEQCAVPHLDVAVPLPDLLALVERRIGMIGECGDGQGLTGRRWVG